MNSPGKPTGPQGPMPDPSPIVQLTTAYWGSQTLFTAIRLKLFDGLAQGARTADEVAASLGLSPRSTGLLLRACASLGLIEATGDRFSNTAMANAFLVSGSPAYMGNAVRYSDQLYGPWAGLEQSVRSGKPAVEPESYLGLSGPQTRGFVEAMHQRAMGVARALVGALDLSGRKNLLDVGGGPGTFSVLLTQRFPGLHADVLELPGVAAVARELVAAAGAADRVSLIDGDYHSSDFGKGRDAVLISGVFHRESAESCQALIKRAANCLQPGGLLAVCDVFADPGGASPAFATLFGLNMMLTAPDGGVHADADVAQWMADSGFQDARTAPLPPPMPHRLVLGIRS